MKSMQVTRYILIVFITIILRSEWIKCDSTVKPLHSQVPLKHNTAPFKKNHDPLKHSTSSKSNKLIKLIEKAFMNIMGLTRRPEKRNKKVEVPDHLWKLYYKWSDENYEDFDKNNADTARIIYHDGKFVCLIYLFIDFSLLLIFTLFYSNMIFLQQNLYLYFDKSLLKFRNKNLNYFS